MAVETPDATETTRRIPPEGKITFEEFLDWCDEDTWAEWVDGEVIMVSPASIGHQDIGSLLDKVLGIYVEVRNLGKVVRAPFVMRLPSRPSGREPDLIFIARERLHLLTNTYLDGPADLAVEIVSPESIGRDRGEKFVEYEGAGIREYWLIDPDRRSVEFYELGADGRYHTAQIGADGIYRSRVVEGFWLRVDWLWQTPLPPALDVLRELRIV
ncbi:MAG TPA: Uma2 family endonuclease [Blastocatellia bacterium]|nr:Uma2 family endonuclease [Blastocatellia bacterium]